ncbi:MAG: hypothetical protein J3R72DRAFT_446076 [Linnemannia gamsii]|nr:MAG: hypothetical protein J3R72DRAFT_446076 [Linnemannia gamsii]
MQCNGRQENNESNRAQLVIESIQFICIYVFIIVLYSLLTMVHFLYSASPFSITLRALTFFDMLAITSILSLFLVPDTIPTEA